MQGRTQRLDECIFLLGFFFVLDLILAGCSSFRPLNEITSAQHFTATYLPPITNTLNPTRISISSSTATLPPTPTLLPFTPTPINLIISAENAANITELARLAKGVIKQTVWSPDGKNIAVGTSVGVYIFDATSFTEILYVETHSQISSLAYTPGGKTLVTSDSYPEYDIRLWDAQSGELIKVIQGNDSAVNCIAIDPITSMLATGDDGGNIILWNLQSGRPRLKLQSDSWRVESIAFSNNNDIVVAGSRYGDIQSWNAINGDLNLHYQPSGEPPVMALAYSPDDRYLASAGNDGKVTLWDTTDGKILFSGDADRTTTLSFNHEGTLLASGSDDDLVRLWEIPSGKIFRTIKVHTDEVTSVAFSPDGKTLITGSKDGKILFWDTDRWEILKTIDGFSNMIIDLAMSPDNTTAISVVLHWQKINVWDLRTSELIASPVVGTDYKQSVAFSPDGKTFATLECSQFIDVGYCSQSSALVWDSQTISVTRTIDVGDNSAQPIKVLFSPDGKYLVTFDGHSESQNIKFWDYLSGGLQDVASGLYIRDAVFNHSGNELVVAILNEIIGFDYPTIQQAYKFNTADWPIAMAISPDDKILAVSEMNGNAEGEIYIYDMKYKVGKRMLTHDRYSGRIPQIYPVAFNPDGSLLASGGEDGSIYLWDTQTWEKITILWHTDAVSTLFFTKDGKYLVSSSGDGTIRIWGIQP